jgi:DNA-binding NarL/FixJ family response regulator
MPGVELTPVHADGQCNGALRLTLAILRGSAAGPDARLAAAAKRWRLTPRETDVLKRVVVEGEPNKVIAANLGCSEATVEVHVTRLLAKAGASSRVALAIAYWRST